MRRRKRRRIQANLIIISHIQLYHQTQNKHVYDLGQLKAHSPLCKNLEHKFANIQHKCAHTNIAN